MLLFSCPVEGDRHEVDSWRRKSGHRGSPRRYRRRWWRVSIWRDAHRHWRRDHPVDPQFRIQNEFFCPSKWRRLAGSLDGERSKSAAWHVPTRSGGKTADAVCLFRSGRHAENLVDYPAATSEQTLPACQVGAISRCYSVRLRGRRGGYWAVLLPSG